MTYLQFHLVFILPPLGLLALLTWRDLRRGRALAGGLSGDNRLAWLGLAGHLLIAVVYTTPWDNYLVYREVWGYPEGRVLFTILYVPIEEYLFFILQTLSTGLLFFTLARRLATRWGIGPASGAGERAGDRVAGDRVAGDRVAGDRVAGDRVAGDRVAGGARLRLAGAGLCLLVAAAGVLALSTERGTYLGLILVWAFPVLALQWGFGGDLLLERWRLVLPGIALPTLYLWVADRIAIGLGIWWISPDLTLGLRPLGLPVEEALFFFLTNVFVVFGLTLVLHPRSWPRLAALRHWARSWWRGVFVLWALSMVPVPLVPAAFPAIAHVSTGLLALGVLGYALERYGVGAWRLFAAAVLFGWAVEWLGSRTGFPFGPYHYNEAFPNLAGVPLIVPLGWWAFSLIALAVAPHRYKLLWAPLALVAWDLGLDPLMVQQGFWTWTPPGPYYTVPLSNFFGWYAAGLVLVGLLARLEPRLLGERGLELRLVFIAQTFLMSVGLVVFGLPLAALATFLAMGALSLQAWPQPERRPRLPLRREAPRGAPRESQSGGR